MELLKFVTAAPGSKAKGYPFTASTPTIRIPLGGNLSTMEDAPIPQSGLDRANWFEQHRVKGERETPALCSSSGAPSIGANERMILGAQRDEYLGGLTLFSHNNYLYNDPVTENSDSVPRVWSAETTASQGLYDEHNDVWSSMDSVTIWA